MYVTFVFPQIYWLRANIIVISFFRRQSIAPLAYLGWPVFLGPFRMPKRTQISMPVSNVPLDPGMLHGPFAQVRQTSASHCWFVFCWARPTRPRPTWKIKAIPINLLLLIWSTARPSRLRLSEERKVKMRSRQPKPEWCLHCFLHDVADTVKRC